MCGVEEPLLPERRAVEDRAAQSEGAFEPQEARHPRLHKTAGLRGLDVWAEISNRHSTSSCRRWGGAYSSSARTKSKRVGGRQSMTLPVKTRSDQRGRRWRASAARDSRRSRPYGSTLYPSSLAHAATLSINSPLAQPTSRKVPSRSIADTMGRLALSQRASSPPNPDPPCGSPASR